MGKAIILTLRAVQVLLALGNMALSAYLIDWFLNRVGLAAPRIFIFLLVAPILSLLSILYLEITPRYAPRATHAFAALAVEILNAVFYMAGFIALAAFLSELAFCNGAQCAAGRADAVVASANFVAWVLSTVLVAKDIFKGGLRAPSTVTWGFSRRASPMPPMAQA